MASNPDNAIGTNGAYGGRTSVDATNDVLGLFQSRGVLSGWAASPNTGLTISLGGDGSTRDVAIAEDNAGNKTTINNISQDPVDVTIPAAPAANSRIDLVVAYVDNPPQGVSTDIDNPGACGIIVVSGVAASTPVAPTDGDIRSAITADGATGAQAYYAVLCKVTIASGTTTLTSSNLQLGDIAIVDQPIATRTITLGYNVTAHLARIGNVAYMNCPTQTNNTFGQNVDNNTVAETIPDGYRPTSSIQVPIPSFRGRIGAAGLQISNAGAITWWALFQSTGTFRLGFSASWETNDNFPTEDL